MRKRYPKLTGMLVVDDVQPGSGGRRRVGAGRHPGGDRRQAHSGVFLARRTCWTITSAGASRSKCSAAAKRLSTHLEVQSLERHYAGRIHRIRRGGGAHPVLPAGAALQSADQGRVRRQPRLCVRQRRHSARRADQLVQRQEDRERSRISRPRLSELADGASAPVRYVTLEDPRAAQLKVIRMDRRWFPARKCKRDDTLGTWPCIEHRTGTGSPRSPSRPRRSSPRPAIRASTAWRPPWCWSPSTCRIRCPA